MKTFSDLLTAYARHLNEVIGNPPELTEYRIASARERGLIAEVDTVYETTIPDDEFAAVLKELIEDCGPEIERTRKRVQVRFDQRRKKWKS